jgi:hypothetical protein
VTAALQTLKREGFLTRAGRRYRLTISSDALASGTGPSRLPVHDR